MSILKQQQRSVVGNFGMLAGKFGIPRFDTIPQTITTHPNNRRYFDEVAVDGAGAGAGGDDGSPILPLSMSRLTGMRIIFNEHLPERTTKRVWHPPSPSADRFCEYGPEDESWMRTLCEWTGDSRYGRIEIVDEGPAFWSAV